MRHTEFSGIPVEKERQVLRISEEKCCREMLQRNRKMMAQKYVEESKGNCRAAVSDSSLGHVVFKPLWERGRSKKRSSHPKNYWSQAPA
jgi:hypothetical protein